MGSATLFDQQLARLKLALGVTQDRDVARALGMTPAALSYRKKANSFPEEKLVGLRMKWPDLDVHLILTGEPLHPGEAPQYERFVDQAHTLGLTPSDVASSIRKGADPRVRLLAEALAHPPVLGLIETLAWCDDESIDLLHRVAATMKKARRVPFSERDKTRRAREP